MHFNQGLWFLCVKFISEHKDSTWFQEALFFLYFISYIVLGSYTCGVGPYLFVSFNVISWKRYICCTPSYSLKKQSFHPQLIVSNTSSFVCESVWGGCIFNPNCFFLNKDDSWRKHISLAQFVLKTNLKLDYHICWITILCFTLSFSFITYLKIRIMWFLVSFAKC